MEAILPFRRRLFGWPRSSFGVSAMTLRLILYAALLQVPSYRTDRGQYRRIRQERHHPVLSSPQTVEAVALEYCTFHGNIAI